MPWPPIEGAKREVVAEELGGGLASCVQCGPDLLE